MIMADRQREQRHLHLMHVADRALRVDRMLRLVSDAGILRRRADQPAGGALSFSWRGGRPDLATGRSPENRCSKSATIITIHETGDAFQAIEPLIALHEMTADAIRRNKPHAIRFSPFDG